MIVAGLMAVVMWEPSAKLDDELQLQLERHGLGNPDARGDGDDGTPVA